MQDGSWTIVDCDWDRVRAVASSLGIDETTATVLVRRGLDDPEAAAAFLAAEPPDHDPLLLGDMEGAVERIQAAVAGRERICVHGDYDVDGVCATAVMVLTLRELGADVVWHLPSRFEEGYGLATETVDRLAADGIDLIVTVDCGITAVDEVAHARALGLDVVVTDHHRPGETLPDCPVVATRPSEYPFPDLCGTGVAFKLASLLCPGQVVLDQSLDLVALATVADVVPLVDENRALVVSGLRALARTRRPGLLALMRTAGVDPATIDAGAIGFRLAPRINAAGRLGRPDIALELLLSDDRRRADELAGELEGFNRERQAVEERIVREATAMVADWSEEDRGRRGYVLWSEEWHEGVIGIVASRLVERFARPVVLVAGGRDGPWKGSGRSIPAFDLHAALSRCSGLLERYGGHSAAAGLSIATERLEAFAEAFAEVAAEELHDTELRHETRVDAVVPARALTLDLARSLHRLGPFGLGNPQPTLLVAAVEAVDSATVGEGRHLRFRIRQHDRDGGTAIAFGLGSLLDRLEPDRRYDVAFRLEENRWNGTSAPQLVVRRVFDTPTGYDELRRWLRDEWRAGEDSWSDEARAVFAELCLEAGSSRELLESPIVRNRLEGDPVRFELPQAA